MRVVGAIVVQVLVLGGLAGEGGAQPQDPEEETPPPAVGSEPSTSTSTSTGASTSTSTSTGASTNPSTTTAKSAAKPVAKPPAPVLRDWRDLAAAGAYDEAYAALPPDLATVLTPEALLLYADVARLSRHPADAVAPLRTLVARHAQDPRAPLAAFTLGRVLLDHLGRPREAAAAFAQAQALDPEGALAEDALAREVEAWSRADDIPRARERARAYLERYPGGSRVRSVRRFGELE